MAYRPEQGGGPATPEALLSAVCYAFGCTPKEALEQDVQTVLRIMEHRMLESSSPDDVDKLTPGQVALWREVMLDG